MSKKKTDLLEEATRHSLDQQGIKYADWKAETLTKARFDLFNGNDKEWEETVMSKAHGEYLAVQAMKHGTAPHYSEKGSGNV